MIFINAERNISIPNNIIILVSSMNETTTHNMINNLLYSHEK